MTQIKAKQLVGLCQDIRQCIVEGSNVKAHLSDPYNEVILALSSLNVAVMKQRAI